MSIVSSFVVTLHPCLVQLCHSHWASVWPAWWQLRSTLWLTRGAGAWLSPLALTTKALVVDDAVGDALLVEAVEIERAAAEDDRVLGRPDRNGTDEGEALAATHHRLGARREGAHVDLAHDVSRGGVLEDAYTVHEVALAGEGANVRIVERLALRLRQRR